MLVAAARFNSLPGPGSTRRHKSPATAGGWPADFAQDPSHGRRHVDGDLWDVRNRRSRPMHSRQEGGAGGVAPIFAIVAGRPASRWSRGPRVRRYVGYAQIRNGGFRRGRGGGRVLRVRDRIHTQKTHTHTHTHTHTKKKKKKKRRCHRGGQSERRGRKGFRRPAGCRPKEASGQVGQRPERNGSFTPIPAITPCLRIW